MKKPDPFWVAIFLHERQVAIVGVGKTKDRALTMARTQNEIPITADTSVLCIDVITKAEHIRQQLSSWLIEQDILGADNQEIVRLFLRSFFEDFIEPIAREKGWV